MMSSLESLMSTATVAARQRTFEAILWGGLAAGVFDAIYAMSVWALRGVMPHRVWQGVASGLLGPSSFQGGLRTAALGITIHFFIALTAATVYVTASRFLPILRERAVLCGCVFGLMVWAFMRFVVIPLSLMRRSNAPFFQWELLGSLSIHAFGVGLPIALSARKYLGRG
jgi:hypothetical protein